MAGEGCEGESWSNRQIRFVLTRVCRGSYDGRVEKMIFFVCSELVVNSMLFPLSQVKPATWLEVATRVAVCDLLADRAEA